MQQQCRPADRIFAAGAAAAGTLAVLLFGCNGAKPTAAPRPAPRWAGVALRVAAPAGPARLLLARHGAAWATATGAKLDVVAPEGDWPAADLVLLEPADLPRWAAAGKARPLPQPGEADVLMPLYRSRLLRWEGVPYGLPVLGDGPVCVYRADLYRDAAAQQAFQGKYQHPLKPPETWDDFADQAEFFAGRRGKPSLPPLPADDAGLTRAFYAAAAPLAVRAAAGGAARATVPGGGAAGLFSFHYDVDTGLPRVAGPGFVEALKLLRRLHPHRSRRPDAAAALRPDEAVLGYVTLADLAALGPEAARAWGVFRAPGSRRVYDDAHPAGSTEATPNVVPSVGTGGCVGLVPQAAAQPDAAFDLLTYLASEGVSLEVVHTPEYGSGPFLDVHLTRHAEGWLSYGLDEPQTALLRDLLREVADPRIDNPAVVLRIPGAREHERVLAEALRPALADAADPAAVLAAVARCWRELDGDPARARADYRRSLGLQP
jgi:ABC-type glycerol-3-phosphate transport system substrate-binding protein